MRDRPPAGWTPLSSSTSTTSNRATPRASRTSSSRSSVRENVRAQVTAALDFNQVEQTSETFKPNPTPQDAAVRSHQSVETVTVNPQQVPSGAPGALTNRPPDSGSQPPTSVMPSSEKPAQEAGRKATVRQPPNTHKENIINYEVDKTIRHTKGRSRHRQAPVGGGGGELQTRGRQGRKEWLQAAVRGRTGPDRNTGARGHGFQQGARRHPQCRQRAVQRGTSSERCPCSSHGVECLGGRYRERGLGEQGVRISGSRAAIIAFLLFGLVLPVGARSAARRSDGFGRFRCIRGGTPFCCSLCPSARGRTSRPICRP